MTEFIASGTWEEDIVIIGTFSYNDPIEVEDHGVRITDHFGHVKLHITDTALDQLIEARAEARSADPDLDHRLRLKVKR